MSSKREIVLLLVLLIILNIFKVAGSSIQTKTDLRPSLITLSSETIDKTEYLSLEELSELIGGNLSWDPLLLKVVLKVGEKTFKLVIDSPLVIVGDGKLKTMEKPVIFRQGIVMVPIEFAQYILNGETAMGFKWDAQHRIFMIASTKTALTSLEKELTPPPQPSSSGPLVVCIDAGHGGKDSGAIGPTGLKEKEVTLDIARKLSTLLKKDPEIKVIMTRTGDDEVRLVDRSMIANKQKVDFFISIHSNAATRKSAAGFETFFFSPALYEEDQLMAESENATAGASLTSPISKAADLEAILRDLTQNAYIELSSDFATIIQDVLLQEFQEFKPEDRKVKQAPFLVLREAGMPAILVECLFISNPAEESRLRQPDFRQKIAQALYNGITIYKVRYMKRMGMDSRLPVKEG